MVIFDENNKSIQIKRFLSQSTRVPHAEFYVCKKVIFFENFDYRATLTDDDKMSLAFEIFPALNTNEILSSSVKRENRLKLCQATCTTHSQSEKFNKMLKNFANFTWFSLLFSPKKVADSLVKLFGFTFKVFICVVFVPFLRGYVCNLGIYLPTLGKYTYMM